MNPVLFSILKVILVGTLATAILRVGPVAVALVIVMAAPYVAVCNLSKR